MKRMNKINVDFVENLQFSIDGFSEELFKNGDFWRLHLDYCQSGKNNELGVYSKEQGMPIVEKTNDRLILTYASLVAEDKSVHDISLQLEINCCGQDVRFSAQIINHSQVRVNELQYPLFEFSHINDDLKNDTLILPLGLGRKIENPHKNAVLHTEYMAADYKNVWGTFAYPGSMSMPWISVESNGMLLYMGCHSDDWRMTTFALGAEPRGDKNERFLMAVCSYPAVYPGEDVKYDGFVLAAFEGDWRKGADYYRSWADKTWNKNPIKKSNSVKNLQGWQRIILKHQYGEIFHTYDELPTLYAEGAKHGINMILLFAWWKEGMDNGYPNYLPDPELGGADKLKEAICKIGEMGGKVILYANGHLIDTATNYYKNIGIHLTMKDIEKNEYREFYKFSNNGTMLRFGHKTFATGCYGTKGWREKLIETEKRHLSLGSNGTFFDQIGICYNLCFDDSHEHGKRIDLDPEYRLRAVKSMRTLLSAEKWFGTEWVSDRLTAQMDFTHGCGFGMCLSDDAYPYIFRYTFSHALISNRFLHDEKYGWRRNLNYAFVHGLIFDVSIYRGRAESLEKNAPNYAEYVGHLISLRKKYLPFFTDGNYDLLENEYPAQIKGTQYTLGKKTIAVLWNDSKESVSISGIELASQVVFVKELN